MLILHPYQTKVLMPVARHEWREPSRHIGRDQFGNLAVQVRFRIVARLDDGHIVWRGFIDDRDEADRFFASLIRRKLSGTPIPVDDWRLPTPHWHPDIDVDVSYEFATVTFLTGSPGSALNYTTPSDWDNANNTIECLGGGGSARPGTSGGGGSGGGGGGAYSKIANLTLSSGSTPQYSVGFGGTNGVTTPFNDSTGSYFNGTSISSASVSADYGRKGRKWSDTGLGGVGGATANGIGTTKFAGGNAGNIPTNGNQGAGGGGAAGPNGAGGAGAAGGTGSGTNLNGAGGGANGGTAGTQGGAGGNNRFGTGGGAVNSDGTAGGGGGAPTINTTQSPGNDGGAGTEWDASHGCGGGGAAGRAVNSNTVDGGLSAGYGGGVGGGAAYGAGGATPPTFPGSQGLIVVTYTPLLKAGGFNLAMMGR